MPACHSCGTTVNEIAAFCGECGADLSEAPSPDDEPLDTGEQIKQRVKAKEEIEGTDGLNHRVTGALYFLGGLVAIGFGYWAGFVGYTETQFGPQGLGVYQITYPIPGIILIILGALGVLAGIGWWMDEDV